MTPPQQNTIVIIGGGFAGVYAARNLRRYLPWNWKLVLFSRENHFVFTPLLGDVVGSSINPMHVVWPIRQMARGVSCLTANIKKIDLEQRQAVYESANGGEDVQAFDHLVLACGAEVNLDIIPGMAAHGLPLKTMGDALVMRNHLIGQMEKAEVERDPALRRRQLSVVVVGGGFSGVEVAGEVADLFKGSSRYYGSHSAGDVRVTLLEGRDRILSELPESLSEFTQKKMRQAGIDIRTEARAASVTENGVRLHDGAEIEAGTVICTIGAAPNRLISQLSLPMKYNRLVVQSDMRVEGRNNVWALGDCAAVPNEATDDIAPPTAQFAVRQAKHLALNIARHIKGEEPKPFAFKPMGMMASIGNHKAVGMLLGRKVSGFPAWILWRGVYLGKMPTLARKIQIAFDWAWQLIFPRDIAQLTLHQTERLGRAHFDKGQFVFHKGDPGDKFYIIESGSAGVYYHEGDPPVTVLNAGDYFGEGSLLRQSPRSASIRADEPLDVLMMTRETFHQMVGHLNVFRQPMERAVRSVRAAQHLMEQAKNNPKLNETPSSQVMSKPITTLPASLTFAEALEQSQAGGRGAYPVVDDHGNMVGLCTRTDFYSALEHLKPPTTPLSDIMHAPVITVKESDSLTKALMKFLRHPIKRLVVVADDDENRPLGMVTPFDIAALLPAEMAEKA